VSFIFNGSERIIYVQSPTEWFNVKDLYSDWKRWVIESDNSKYAQAMKSIGGERISDTISISPYIEVMNEWKIKPYDGVYELSVYGNIFATGGLNPFVSADNGTVTIKLEVTSNSLAITGNEEDIQNKLDTIISTLELNALEKKNKGFA
jgi:hypothetical protein